MYYLGEISDLFPEEYSCSQKCLKKDPERGLASCECKCRLPDKARIIRKKIVFIIIFQLLEPENRSKNTVDKRNRRCISRNSFN